MTTTHTFNHDSDGYKARHEFSIAHQHAAYSNRCGYLAADLDTATIEQAHNVIVSNVWTDTEMVVTLGSLFYVAAVDTRDGETKTVITYGAHSGYTFSTEAEARKFLARVRKLKIADIAKAATLAAAADEAKRVCAVNPMFTDLPVFDGTNPEVQVGSYVKFHGMGKWRVGVVTGKTPSKWILAYTTPSNVEQIREVKVRRI